MGCVPPACCPYLQACTALGGCLPEGSVFLGGLPGFFLGGVFWGGLLLGGGLPLVPGVYPSIQWGRHPPVDRILDTRFWKYYLAPTSLRAIKIGKNVNLSISNALCFTHSSLAAQNYHAPLYNTWTYSIHYIWWSFWETSEKKRWNFQSGHFYSTGNVTTLTVTTMHT